MKKLFLFALLAVFTVGGIQAQDAVEAPKKATKAPNMWKTLAKITFKKEYDELMGFKIDVPVFSKEIKALEGKEVTIKDKSHKEFIFSAFPYNMCFFCGGAGPETVMEVFSKEAIEYTAEAVTIKGKLELNADDINRLMYGMSEVTLVKD